MITNLVYRFTHWEASGASLPMSHTMTTDHTRRNKSMCKLVPPQEENALFGTGLRVGSLYKKSTFLPQTVKDFQDYIFHANSHLNSTFPLTVKCFTGLFYTLHGIYFTVTLTRQVLLTKTEWQHAGLGQVTGCLNKSVRPSFLSLLPHLLPGRHYTILVL